MSFVSKYKTDKRTYIAIVFILFFGLGFFFFQRSEKRLLNYEFNGVIDSVGYCAKGFPYVKINNKVFYLEADWNFNHSLNVGDTMIKKKNSLEIKVIKKETGETQIFK